MINEVGPRLYISLPTSLLHSYVLDFSNAADTTWYNGIFMVWTESVYQTQSCFLLKSSSWITTSYYVISLWYLIRVLTTCCGYCLKFHFPWGDHSGWQRCWPIFRLLVCSHQSRGGTGSFRLHEKVLGDTVGQERSKKAWSKFKFRTISANKTVWECCFTWRGFFCWLCSSRLNQQIKFCSCNFEHLKDYFRQRISKIWNMIFRQFLPLRVFYTKDARASKTFSMCANAY